MPKPRGTKGQPKSSPQQPGSADTVIWYGTRAEYGALLQLRQKQLDEAVQTRKNLTARGMGSNSYLDSSIITLRQQVESLTRWKEEAKA